MIHEHERVVRMVAELQNFLFSMGASEIRSEIRETPEAFLVSIKGNTRGNICRKVEKLRKLLSLARRADMEEELWSLAGSVDFDTELSLVGMMSDRAEVRCDGDAGVVEVELVRRK
ncbi:MAG TPA: hypothetical protein PLY83_02780 [Synergistales bacterium]|nr:hypothetical protein [Synergistales bacterium]